MRGAPLLAVLVLACSAAAPPADRSRDEPGYLGFGFSYNKPSPHESAGWLLVRYVKPGTPAHAAGLQPQAVIVAVNGRSLAFDQDIDVLHLLGAIRPGDEVTLTLGGQQAGTMLTMIAVEMPPDALRLWKANFDPAPQPEP